jgi:hypothetical protein
LKDLNQHLCGNAERHGGDRRVGPNVLLRARGPRQPPDRWRVPR